MNRALLVTASSLLLGLAAACGSSGGGPDEPLPQGGFPDAGGTGPCDVDGDGVDGPSCHGADCDDSSAQVHPGADESCDTPADDDCDGYVNEGCGCVPGDMESCFEFDDALRHVGRCADGYKACKADGTWGACTGSVGPEGELTGCDGIDSNCNGNADDDKPECGTACPPDAAEICGNGLDDDCDGEIDPPEVCTVSCAGVNPRSGDPGDLACCLRSPAAIYEFRCHEGGDLAACADRTCIDLDGTLDTRCSKLCTGGNCVCGRRTGTGDIIEVADCGFLTPCARLDCDDRDGQPCYEGPPRTLGKGICRGGVHSCNAGGGGAFAWDQCVGQQLPLPEVCGNGLDDDCDGYIDEAGGTDANCNVRARCAPGAVELCGNGLDDDCDGFADEGCPAAAGARHACWTGPLDARGTGTCKDGSQREAEGYFGACTGQVLPRREICGDKLDTDCNGVGGPGQPEEVGCCTPKPETCNGVDDDCNGLADEGLVNRCGQCEGTGSCFGATIDDVGDCSVPGRICEGVEASRFDPSLITLVGNPGTIGGSQSLYAIHLLDSKLYLIQVDVGAGEVTWAKEYPAGLNGVIAGADGAAWVSRNDRIEHVSPDGEVLCRTDSTSSETAPDPEGDLWLNLGGSDRRYSATEVLPEQSPGVPWPDGIPRCAIVDLTPSDPNTTDISVNISNVLVHDGQRVWNFGSGLGVNYIKLDDLTLHTVEPTTQGAWFAYPILGPDGRLYGGGPLRYLDPEEAKDANPVAPYHALGTYPTVSYVGALSDASVVGLMPTPSTIVQVDSQTGEEIDRFVAPADLTTAISVDAADRVWATAVGKLLALDVSTGNWDEMPIGGLVGINRFAISRGTVVSTASKGRWAQYFDPGAFDVRWGQLTWDANEVAGTHVKAQVHFSDVADTLETSPFVCGPFTSSPADLSTCSGGRRYALVELLLSGSGKPVAGHVGLTWDRP